MIIEGKNPVLEAIASGTLLDKLTVQKGLSDNTSNKIIAAAREAGVRINFVEKEAIDRQSTTGRHQGFIAVTGDFVYCSVEDILSLAEERGEPPFLAIADGIEDPHNLGSIIRVCECAGVHGLIIPERRAVSVNETVLRVSAGAAQHLKIARVGNINNTIRDLKQKNIWIYSAETTGSDLYKTNLRGAVAFVIGGENAGVRELTAKLSDYTVKIPMSGQINSLNASVACGVVLFEAVRQRSAEPPVK